MSVPVFISYSSKDIQIAQKICAAVEERGFACWLAHRDVRPGENFQIAVVRAIRASRVMLLVFTDNANKSTEVEKELVLASRERLSIIPIRIERVELSEAFDYQFATRQWIDLFEDWEHEIKRLTQALESGTGIKARAVAQPVAPPPEPESPAPPKPHETSADPPPSTKIVKPVTTDAEIPSSPAPAADLPPSTKVTKPETALAERADPLPQTEDRRLRGGPASPPHQTEQPWALVTVLTIGAIAIFAAALTGDQSVSNGLRDWTSPLLALVSIASLIVMTIGLAFAAESDGEAFTESLKRSFVAVGLTLIVWIIYGYSLAYSGGSDYVGGLSRAFLRDSNGRLSTFTAGVTIAEASYVIFQGCAAALTSVLIVAAIGSKLRFVSLIWFVPLWATVVCFPLMHMMFYWAGADAITDAAKAVATATDEVARRAAHAKLDETNADAGWLYKKGVIDYAGGTVFAMGAGIAALIGRRFLGEAQRGNDDLAVSPTFRPAGPILIWLGWFGLIAVSYLDFGDWITRLAMANAFAATAAAAAIGMMMEWALRGAVTLRGVLYCALGGVIAVVPAAGFASPLGAAVLGIIGGAMTAAFIPRAFPASALPLVYFLNGTLGMVATGILVNQALGGTGVMDYSIGRNSDYDLYAQMVSQFWGLAITILWTAAASAAIYAVIDATIGLRPAERRADS